MRKGFRGFLEATAAQTEGASNQTSPHVARAIVDIFMSSKRPLKLAIIDGPAVEPFLEFGVLPSAANHSLRLERHITA